jgi:hypothetical protein
MLVRWLTVLLIVLQLQPVLAFMPEPAGSISQQFEHAVIHQGGTGHHHDSHSGVQIDDGFSVGHVHHDASHHVVLLTAVDPWRTPAHVSVGVASCGSTCLPDPDLEGPLRPPSLSA